MPVTSASPVKSATGNGVTTVFPYDFLILDEDDLKVTIDGVTQTITTHYTVSGVGEGSGGNVTFVSAPANGTLVVLEGNATYDRATDYQRNGSFDEQTVDRDFDRAIILIKQLKATIDRVPQLKAGLTLTQPSLPDPVAGEYLRWNPSANGLEGVNLASVIPSGTTVVSAFWNAVLDEINLANSLSAMGIASDIRAFLATANDAAARTELGAAAAANPVLTGLVTIDGQIKFPATQNPSADVNTFDDYEEGTWTPSVGGTATYTGTPSGHYIKIGKTVFFSGTMIINAIGTGSTQEIGGLPIAVAGNMAHGQVVSFNALATAVASVYLQSIAATSCTFVGVAAGGGTGLTVTNLFGNGTAIKFSGMYEAI